MVTAWGPEGTKIHGQESFDVLVRKLSIFFNQHITAPHTFEDLQKALYTRALKPLTWYLVKETHHPALVSALLALKWHFSTVEDEDDAQNLNETKGLACELIAWRYVTHLTQKEAIDALCYEVPSRKLRRGSTATWNSSSRENGATEGLARTERTPLLDGSPLPDSDEEVDASNTDDDTTFETVFEGLNALEIAAVAEAKKFMSQSVIQRMIYGLWRGDIVFWETLSARSVKEAKVYNEKRTDLFCRLRVPMYLKIFEVAFFAAFLAIYYSLLVQKPAEYISVSEILLYIWLAAFAYNELGEYLDAGRIFYSTDFWAVWDIGIIATGVVFFVLRMIGLANGDEVVTEIAFDVLSVEALFLVPRICSLLSLHPYFGTLIPCLKEMTKDFVKFLGLVAILYLGFDTCFAFLARGTYSFSQMNWILIKVFFGSSYLGFDVAEKISPVLGPPLMFIFVCMTNILLITSLISLLSNSLTKVIEHAREEYLFVYAVYVLEASNSNRLTYFLPPLNLLPLLLRPFRLVVGAERLRAARIVLLKATHWPFVALILGYERARVYWNSRRPVRSSGLQPLRGPFNSPTARRRRPLSGGPLRSPLRRTGTGGSSLLVRETPEATTVPFQPELAAFETMDDVGAAIANVQEQVERLSTMVAAMRTKQREMGEQARGGRGGSMTQDGPDD